MIHSSAVRRVAALAAAIAFAVAGDAASDRREHLFYDTGFDLRRLRR